MTPAGRNTAPRQYRRPDYQPDTTTPLHERARAWLHGRGITDAVIARNQIGYTRVFMPQVGKEVMALAFPYFRDGVVINVKYRDGQKHFCMEKDAELCLYGLDDIVPGERLVWVEGEMDKLAVEVAGIRACVSVPNGASGGSAPGGGLGFLEADWDRIMTAERHIIAVDADAPGRRLGQELIRRLGPGRAWVAKWPR